MRTNRMHMRCKHTRSHARMLQTFHDAMSNITDVSVLMQVVPARSHGCAHTRTSAHAHGFRQIAWNNVPAVTDLQHRRAEAKRQIEDSMNLSKKNARCVHAPALAHVHKARVRMHAQSARNATHARIRNAMQVRKYNATQRQAAPFRWQGAARAGTGAH